MNQELEEDLGRWEAGAMSVRDLGERHPDVDVTSLTELHLRLVSLGREPTPDPIGCWASLEARLTDRRAGVVPVGRPRRRRSHVRRIAVLGLAAALSLGGGLAMAGALPAPAQDAVANMAGHLGLELPHADEHPPATTHGAEVSDLARSTTAEGCAKGQAIAAAASVKAAAHRQNPTEKADPCAKTSPGDAGSKRPGRASGAGSRTKTEQGARGAGRGAGPEPPGLEHRAPGRSGDQP